MENNGQSSDARDIKILEDRINELGDKSSQTLLFLSFALVVAATLRDRSASDAIHQAMHWWSFALFPTLLGILPLKEVKEGNVYWYSLLRWFKFILLWAAVLCIGLGAYWLARAI